MKFEKFELISTIGSDFSFFDVEQDFKYASLHSHLRSNYYLERITAVESAKLK